MSKVRLIDANALRDSVRKAWSGTKPYTAAAVVVEFIDNAPTINPVNTPDVCRCEECELWNDWDKVGRESLGTLRCSCGLWSTGDGHTTYTAPNDFCSYGVKKGKE